MKVTVPIKKENLKRYPANWKQLRAAVLERAGHKCEHCGVPNYAVGYRSGASGQFITSPTGVLRIVLTIAHLDHDELETQDISRLRAWCQKCHLTYDAKHHAQTARQTRHGRKATGELF